MNISHILSCHREIIVRCFASLYVLYVIEYIVASPVTMKLFKHNHSSLSLFEDCAIPAFFCNQCFEKLRTKIADLSS